MVNIHPGASFWDLVDEDMTSLRDTAHEQAKGDKKKTEETIYK